MSALKLFTNLLVYRIHNDNELHSFHLNDLMGERPARAPGNQELATIGFVKPTGEDDLLVDDINNETRVFAVGIAERMLPAKIVRTAAMKKVRQIENEQQRKVYAREKQQIKDEVIQDLLPRAFIDTRVIYGMIMGPYLIIDTSSVKRAESVLNLLRETMGSLGVRPVTVKGTPISKFTDWFTHKERLHHFELTGDFKANSSGDEFDFVNGKGTSPTDETLSDLVRDAERRVTVLGLQHHCDDGEGVSFTVNEMLGIKGVKWPDHLIEQANDDAGALDDQDEVDAEKHASTLLRATFLLIAAEMHKLLQNLLLELGGEEVPDGEIAEHQQLQIGYLDRVFRRDLLAGLAADVEDYRERFGATFVSAQQDDGASTTTGVDEAEELI